MFVLRFFAGIFEQFAMHRLRIKIENSLLTLVFAIIISMALYTSCANQGMPTGGPKDSIPPILIETSPAYHALNFSGKEVSLTFNEYIISDAVSEQLVVSPPLQKRPSIRTKSKSLIVSFNEDLKSDMTYSLDFKNSVADNNERNPYKSLRMIFSTGSQIDTLRVAGAVKNAFNLESTEKILVMLHQNLNDTAISSTIPDYVARTDEKGIFLFDNVKAGTYKLFAVNDANQNLMYDSGAEEIAFADSLIIPTAEFRAEPDTLAKGADSLLIAGNTYFFPEPVYLRTFMEDFFDQFLEKSVRDTRHKSTLVFSEPVTDTLDIKLLGFENEYPFILEPNPAFDSITVWLTDTLIASNDTLKFRLTYTDIDSLDQRFLKTDTVNMVFTDRATRSESRRRSRDEDEVPEIVQFSFSDNIKTTGFDLNLPVTLYSPEPIDTFDFSSVRIIMAEDLAQTPLPITIQKDTIEYRTWQIRYNWEPNMSYLLEVDSAAARNIYGITNRKISRKFTTQKDDYYGSIILQLASVSEPMLIQLLDNSKDEKVIKTLHAQTDGSVSFDFLAPNKYKIKFIYDTNNNGKWDTGSLKTGIQPEKVAYFPEIIKVRSNWENEYPWDVTPNPEYPKKLIDKEEEEMRRKKEQEERQKQDEQEREPVQMDFGGRSLGMPRAR
ncbi:protein containing bacterial Ig-like domain [Bacteroidales bacterium 6E]|nr:protein containing bacterial Ig-like domain [Bacteroidales bacterium 6E]